jgi:hypothetical protein
MSEQGPTAEQTHYNREQVIEMFKKFPERGITDPHALPLNDSEVIEANKVLDAWTAQQETLARQKGTVEADLDFSLNRTTILVDAGFSDPHYLNHVANDWLINDLQRAQDAGLNETSEWIAGRIYEINSKIPD